MFGLRKSRRTRGGTLGQANLQRALLAGAGMLAIRWWRNRQASNRMPKPGQPAGASYADSSEASPS
jgi:hypothetical protein